ncbi:MAG TPA: ABC transporter substrate-binding protein [Candidatus Limnocylindrales bacterium]|nr:ABC transporter substrate-binding protein [Candidatus Limnocylindrales bacterium]
MGRLNTPRAAVGLLAVAALVFSACGGGASPTAPPASQPAAQSAAPSTAAVDAKTATSANDLGGVSAMCAAGKAEGQVTLIATPNNWANYGQMISDFSAKYGIKVQSDQPDADSQAEINTAKQLAGTGRQPDIFDLGTVVALANTAMYAPYKPVTWAQIPDANKEATGLWINNYTGFEAISYDASLGDITKVADLADPKYKGKVALNGDPLKAAAGFNGVVLAALANGGSADNIKPGVDFFKHLHDIGNLIPVDPDPGTIAGGTTPIVIDWTYNEGSLISTLAPKGITWKLAIPSDAPPVAAYYNEAINKDAAHPAAARCWIEYVFSDAGQNTWLKGFALPVRLAAMITAKSADTAALAAVNAPTTAPVQLTLAQIDAAKTYLTANWTFITIK